MVRGIKRFSVTRKVPKELESPHISELNSIFQKLSDELFVGAHKSLVSINKVSKGYTYTFMVHFGSNKENKEEFYIAINKLVDISLWLLISNTLKQKANFSLRNTINKYQTLCISKQIHKIHVKPKEHIKLC